VKPTKEGEAPGRSDDVCYCGDYRHQHEDGVGRCRLNGLGHPGGAPCLKFRLFRAALAEEG
jgi:hypothetical protein